MSSSQFTISDAILLVGLMYVASDLGTKWRTLHECRRPLSFWFTVSLGSVILNRLCYFLGQYMTSESATYIYDEGMNELLLFSDPRGPPKWISIISLGFLFPFFILWTILGSIWFSQALDTQGICFSHEGQVWLLLGWLLICYLWVGLYFLFIFVLLLSNPRDAAMDNNFTMFDDTALVRRWGSFSIFPDSRDVFTRGLSIGKIHSLPYITIKSDEHATRLQKDCGHCAICLDMFFKNDEIRRIHPCKHVFHRGCIDQWMLRSACCPNCKGIVTIRGTDTNSDSYSDISSQQPSNEECITVDDTVEEQDQLTESTILLQSNQWKNNTNSFVCDYGSRSTSSSST